MVSRPPPIGSLEPDMDVPRDITEAGSRVGSQAVIKHLTGVDLPPDLNQANDRREFARSVSGSIFRTFAQVRNNLTQAGLRDLLDQRIGEELRKSQGRVTTLDQAEQSALALNVMLEVLGPNVIERRANELVMPYENAEPNTRRGTLSKDIDLSTTPLAARFFSGTTAIRRVTINPGHPFWRGDVPADADALRAKLAGKPLSEVGVEINGVPQGEILTAQVAEIIAGTNATPAPFEAIDITRDYGVCRGRDNNKDWSVNITALIRERVTLSTGQRLFVGALDRDDLVDALNVNTFWNRVVSGLSDEEPSFNVPGHGYTWSERIADSIFTQLGKAPGGPLATDVVQLRDVNARIAENARTFDRLRDGAVNTTGAVIAMSMIAQRPELIPQFATVDKTAAEARKAELEKRKLARAEADRVAAMPYGPFASYYNSLKDVDDDLANLAADRAGINVSTYTVWASRAAANDPVLRGVVPNTVGRGDISNVQKRFDAVLDEAKKEKQKFEALATGLTQLRKALDDNGVTYGTQLTNYFVSGGPNIDPTKIDKTKTPKQIVDAVAAGCTPPLQLVPALDALIKTEDDAIKAADERNALKGDQLQFEVFKRYCEERGIAKPAETANYVAARSFLDADVIRRVGNMLDERFDESEGKNFSVFNTFYWDVINNVAAASGVRIAERPSNWMKRRLWTSAQYQDPDWGNASYESLVSAYYSLRNMHDGKEGWHFNLGGSNEVKRQLKTIGTLIATKFGLDFYNANFAKLSAEDIKKLGDNKPKRITETTVRQLLDGDPPPGFEPRIAHVIERTKGRVSPVKQTLYKVPGLGAGLIGTVAKFGGNRVWGENYSLNSLTKTSAAKWTWKNRLAVGVLAGLAIGTGGLAFPALTAAAYAAGGSDEQK